MERKQIFHKAVIEQFALQIKKMRKDRGFTQEALAHHSGLSLSQIARIETAKLNPTLSTIYALAKGLNSSLHEVFDFA